MRIEIAPELLEEARGRVKRPEANRRPEQVIRLPKPTAQCLAPPASEDFQQLLQNIYDGALITEIDGTIVKSNLRSHQFFAAEPAQLEQHSILSLICGAEEALLGTIFETLENNRFVLMQAYCLRTDGTYFPAEISVNRLRLGECDRLSFFVRDITLRKEQEEKLRTGNIAIQNSSSAIAITDSAGQIEFTNPAFLSFFLIGDPAEATALNLGDLLCDREKIAELIETVGRGETWESELELRRMDENTFFGHVSISANVNSEGEQVGMVLSILDVSVQKQAQQQLESYAEALHARNNQMQEDLDVAGELHQALLPASFRCFPRQAGEHEALVHFRHLYCPCGTIGGDFYDIREVSDDQVAVFLADVMGHGIRSALVVATIRGLLEQLRPYAEDPGALLRQLNATYTKIFKQMGSDVTFSTALFALLDTRTGLLRYANASHPRPYLIRPGEVGQLRPAEEGGSAALGLFAGTQYQTHELQMRAGDTLLLYTDGLSEIEAPSGELYDERAFEQVLLAHQAEASDALLDAVIESAHAFAGSEAFDDDVCLLAVHLRALRAAGPP